MQAHKMHTAIHLSNKQFITSTRPHALCVAWGDVRGRQAVASFLQSRGCRTAEQDPAMAKPPLQNMFSRLHPALGTVMWGEQMCGPGLLVAGRMQSQVPPTGQGGERGQGSVE